MKWFVCNNEQLYLIWQLKLLRMNVRSSSSSCCLILIGIEGGLGVGIIPLLPAICKALHHLWQDMLRSNALPHVFMDGISCKFQDTQTSFCVKVLPQHRRCSEAPVPYAPHKVPILSQWMPFDWLFSMPSLQVRLSQQQQHQYRLFVVWLSILFLRWFCGHNYANVER